MALRGAAWLAGALTALAAVFVMPAGVLHAQRGTELRGMVTVDGRPAAGAVVQATGEGGRSARAAADSAGFYRVQLPADGPYLVSVRADGLNGSSRFLPAAAGGAPGVRTADFHLTERIVAMDPVSVRVPPFSVTAATRYVPGSREQSRGAVALRDEPLTSDLVADVAAREAGVALSADGSGLAVSGQPADQTRLTLDGSEAASIAVPREAVRAVNLLTSTYDVARGRFTGGVLDVQTLRGGNEWGGTARVAGSGSALEYGGSPGVLGSRSSLVSLDAGGGGALVRDRIFSYSAVSANRSESRAPWLPDLDGNALRRLGLDPDSVSRFLAVTAPAGPARVDRGPAVSRSTSVLSRLDAVLTPRHSVMLRVAGQTSSISDPERALTVPGTGTGFRQHGVGMLGQLNSGGQRLANEFRVGVGNMSRGGEPADPVPSGILLTGGTGTSSAVLRFAGSPGAGSQRLERSWEVADQVVARTASGNHRLRLGGEFSRQEYERSGAVDHGTFIFESLADLAANRPARYTRSLDTSSLDATSRRATVFVDDLWTEGEFQLSYGVRAERIWTEAATRVPAVEEHFGADGGRLPSSWRLSPRVGFGFTTRMPWDRGPNGRTSINGGFGHFVGALPLSTLATGLGDTGRPEAAELRCAGVATPVPDWRAYRAGASAPASCADGAPALASRMAQATIFSPSFSPPEAWRASIGGQGVLQNGIGWNVSAAFLAGVQPLAFDRNLHDQPRFRNESEGGRPVYVRPEDIDPLTGLPSLAASRLYPELGVVREATSGGRSQTVQLSASINHGFLSRRFGIVLADLGYTWTHGRELTGGLPAPGAGFATAGGEPSRLEWSVAGYAPRHVFQVYGGVGPSSRLWLGLTSTLSSGRPFTPMVGGDVNGDGVENDRAFVFDPQSVADPGIAEAMARLLNELPGGVRRCIRAQVGQIAGPASCRTGWATALDLNLRYSIGPHLASSPRPRASLWLVASNVPGGLDYLLHGADDLRGWGQPARVDPVLLSVRGFDPAAREFRYEVNRGFGRSRSTSQLTRFPFSISVQVRMVLGTDRGYRDFRNQLAAAQVNAPAFTPGNIRLHASRQLPNVPAEILALNLEADLRLSPEQGRRLEEVATGLLPRIEAVISAVVAGVAQTSSPPTLTADGARALSMQAAQLRAEGVSAAREILTAEQWERVPARLREVGRRFSPYPPEEFSGLPDH